MNIEESILNCEHWKSYTGFTKKPINNIFHKYFILFLFLLREILCFLISKKNKKKEEKPIKRNFVFLVFSFSYNHQKALSFLKKRKDILLYKEIYKIKSDIHLSSIRSVIKVFSFIKKRKDSNLLLPWLKEIVHYYTSKNLWEKALLKYKPKAIILCNDHSGMCRSLIIQAKSMGIITIYTQHGSIGKYFPPLITDISMLDGYQPYLQYQKISAIDGIVVMTGRQKTSLNVNKKAVYIGLGPNTLDRITDWISLIKKLKKTKSKIILRPHPADPRKILWKLICNYYGIIFSNDSLESFLTRCVAIFTGLSGLALDSALRGINVYYYGKKHFLKEDYYGYIKYNIIKKIDNKFFCKELFRIKIDPQIRKKASFYESGVFYNPFDAKNEVLDCISKKIENENLDYKYFLNLFFKGKKNIFFKKCYEMNYYDNTIL